MARPHARVLLALGVVLGLFAEVAPGGAAQAVPEIAYLPWVPNGAMLGSMGPFTAAVTIQNLEAQPARVRYWATKDYAGGDALKQRDLPPLGSFTVSAADIGVPSPGSGVMVTAYSLTTLQDSRVAATVKVSAPVGPDIPAFEARTSNVHQVVDGYTGLTEDDRKSTVVLPIVQTNSGWNSVIRVTHFGTLPNATITVTLRPSGGGDPTILNQTVEPGATTSFDLTALGVASGFIGSAIVSSPGSNAAIGAVVERYKASTNMLVINTAKWYSTCSTELYAPLVFDNYHSWNTGISIFNWGDVPDTATVTYYRMNGTVLGDATLPIPAKGMNYIYTPAAGAGDGFVGAAVIHGSQWLCAVVDEVKYTGTGGDVGHAMSYATFDVAAWSFQAQALPLAQKGTDTTGHGDTTGIQVFNPSPSSVIVEVTFISQTGIAVLTQQLTVAGHTSATVYAMTIALPNGFQGSAIIDVISGNGEIVAISNNVNYAVQFDGSASFTPVLVP